MGTAKIVVNQAEMWVIWSSHLRLASEEGQSSVIEPWSYGFCIHFSWLVSELNWILGHPIGEMVVWHKKQQPLFHI